MRLLSSPSRHFILYYCQKSVSQETCNTQLSSCRWAFLCLVPIAALTLNFTQCCANGKAVLKNNMSWYFHIQFQPYMFAYVACVLFKPSSDWFSAKAIYNIYNTCMYFVKEKYTTPSYAWFIMDGMVPPLASSSVVRLREMTTRSRLYGLSFDIGEWIPQLNLSSNFGYDSLNQQIFVYQFVPVWKRDSKHILEVL